VSNSPLSRRRPRRAVVVSLLALGVLGLWGTASATPAPRALPARTAAPQAPASGSPSAQPPWPASLTPLQADQGQVLLFRSRQRADFGPLIQEFLTQETLSYCGVASAVMVLNSLAVPAPAARGYGSYRFWTQDNLFEGGSGGPAAEVVQKRGMTLAQLRELLAGRGVAAMAIEASQLSLAELRQLLRRSLADPEDRLLVNYNRQGIGQAGGGHISPLAAMDETSDKVLILDVARYRYPATWVPLGRLLQAMQMTDRDSGRSRGLVLIRRLNPGPAGGAAAAPPPPGTAAPPGPN
jgi:hypothetical protein